MQPTSIKHARSRSTSSLDAPRSSPYISSATTKQKIRLEVLARQSQQDATSSHSTKALAATRPEMWHREFQEEQNVCKRFKKSKSGEVFQAGHAGGTQICQSARAAPCAGAERRVSPDSRALSGSGPWGSTQLLGDNVLRGSLEGEDSSRYSRYLFFCSLHVAAHSLSLPCPVVRGAWVSREAPDEARV